MSYSALRTGLYNYFGGATPNVSGITTVFKAQPKEIAESQMPAMFFSIPDSEETRVAIQRKMVAYQVYILVVSIGYDTDAQTAETAFETIIDNIVTKLRLDKQLTGIMLRFAEDFDISISTQRNEEAVLLNAVIKVQTDEIITS